MHFIRNALKRTEFIDALILLLLALVIARGWLNSGLSKGHDALVGFAFHQTLFDSLFKFYTFPYHSDYWYLGTPLFTIFPPMFSFIEMIFVSVLGAISGVKVMYFLFFWLSGVFMYLFVRHLTGSRSASFIAALMYMYNPYFLAEFIFEGHGDQLLGFMLAPLLFWGLERTIKKPSPGNAALCGIFLALLILSFPQAFPLLIGPFFVAYVLFHLLTLFRDRKQITSGLRVTSVIFLVGLCLSAFWWLPLLFERGMMHSTEFAKLDSLPYSLTSWQAITLRPPSCCSELAPTTVNPLYISIWQMIVPVLAILGISLNYKNKRVWFFAIMAAISILLAMGLKSPIGLYGFCFDHLPFFNSIRTPGRFLLFTTFCYSVLGGYAIMTLGKIIKGNVKRFILVGLMSALVVGNVWTESQQAFQTFRLSPDQENAFAWLKEQEDGDYRIANPPFRTWLYDPEIRNIVNPTYWTYLHGKETVSGGAPAAATKYAVNTLNSLHCDLENGRLNIGGPLSILNVKYLILDKTDPFFSNVNVILVEGFKSVWTSDTIDIYENRFMKPRIFSLSATNERLIDLWSGSRVNLSWAEGTQDAMLSLDSEHCLSRDFSVKSTYQFTNPYDEWLYLEANIESMDFDQDDAIRLVFYSKDSLPDIHLSLDLFERDGSRYSVKLGAVDGIKAGWNEIDFPISFLNLKYSTDENDPLNFDEINRLLIGAGEQRNGNKAHEFEFHFDKLSVVSHEINSNIEYTKIRPGKYEVHIDFDKPSYLVLAESYHPNWVARHDGEEIHSQMIYEALNGFYLEEGQYDVTLEFVNSPPRRAGNLISGISIIMLCLVTVFLLTRKKRSEDSPQRASLTLKDWRGEGDLRS